jgi:hypothetical protein
VRGTCSKRIQSMSEFGLLVVIADWAATIYFHAPSRFVAKSLCDIVMCQLRIGCDVLNDTYLVPLGLFVHLCSRWKWWWTAQLVLSELQLQLWHWQWVTLALMPWQAF